MTVETIRASVKSKLITGSTVPRIAPPVPARHQAKEFKATAAKLGYELYPWQETAARYLTALGADERWLYSEVAIIVARQNGKTTLLLPLIVGRLLAGQKIMHTAQNRIWPMDTHDAVATLLLEHFKDQLPRKRGIRYGAGQEQIKLLNGGQYRIVAPSRAGARGAANDTVIIDEVREMVDTDFISAAKPTIIRSQRPQMVYLSNAGTEQSIVLNAIKSRAGEDPALAYLEWSAEPSRATDDETGWLEANPTIGHDPGMLSWLRGEYRTKALEGNLHIFNTEHLCRWVTSDLPAFVEAVPWLAARRPALGKTTRPALAVSLDPSGKRASMAVAWQDADGINLRIIGDVTGDPIDTDKLGTDIRGLALKLGIQQAGYDPETDAHLGKYLRKPEAITGGKFTAACSRFVALAESGRLKWEGPDELIEDMRWTSRHTDPQDGTYRAVRAKEDRPVTPIMAAIRAVWLASGPRLSAPRVM